MIDRCNQKLLLFVLELKHLFLECSAVDPLEISVTYSHQFFVSVLSLLQTNEECAEMCHPMVLSLPGLALSYTSELQLILSRPTSLYWLGLMFSKPIVFTVYPCCLGIFHIYNMTDIFAFRFFSETLKVIVHNLWYFASRLTPPRKTNIKGKDSPCHIVAD